MKMTPQQKIQWIILNRYFEEEGVVEVAGVPQLPAITAENIEDVYYEYEEECEDTFQDYKYELRDGEVETDIPCEHSRHYEAKSVAAQAPDGTWVGWTYWYGGGKHAEPEAIDWINKAYDLDCQEEEKLVVVQTFTKVE